MTLYLEDFPDPPSLEDIFPTSSIETSVFFENEAKKPYFKNLNKNIIERYFSVKSTQCYPPFNKIFYAFEKTPLETVRVVLLGQDPYHGPNQANGLCFSVNNEIKAPPSLKNIFTEIKSDLGLTRTNTDLSDWAEQGILLINYTLTVEQGKPNSHVGLGWNNFIDNIVKYINEKCDKVVWILWGGFAQKKCSFIDSNKHLILKGAHPSPLSVTKFYGCKHFSQTNNYLKKNNKKEIKWV